MNIHPGHLYRAGSALCRSGVKGVLNLTGGRTASAVAHRRLSETQGALGNLLALANRMHLAPSTLPPGTSRKSLLDGAAMHLRSLSNIDAIHRTQGRSAEQAGRLAAQLRNARYTARDVIQLVQGLDEECALLATSLQTHRTSLPDLAVPSAMKHHGMNRWNSAPVTTAVKPQFDWVVKQ